MDQLIVNLFWQRLTIGDLSHLPVAAPYIAMMPQWDMLDFIADHAKLYPALALRMNCEATAVKDAGAGWMSLVTLAHGSSLQARLESAAKCVLTVPRDAAGLPADAVGRSRVRTWCPVAYPAAFIESGGD